MQFGGLIGTLVALAATLGLLGWVGGRLAVRSCARLLGPIWREQDERGFRTKLWYLRLAVVALALLAAFLGWRAVLWLAPSAGGAPGWGTWGAQAARGLIFAAAALVAVTALWSVFGAAREAAAALRRRRVLIGRDAPSEQGPPLLTVASAGAPALPPGQGRRIVICCDGTGNRPDAKEAEAPAATNVWKLYKGLACNEEQITWYDPGVATDTSSTASAVRWSRWLLDVLGAKLGGWIMATLGRIARVFEGATGTGITENVAQAYAEIVRYYRPGDRIYLIGFSRGAYTVRCVAGVIERCGLLRAEHLRYADDLVHLYRNRSDPAERIEVAAGMTHDPEGVRVEFLGVFDTVGALGVPLWGWWFRALPHWRNEALSTNPMRVCKHVYHAMAMDERRSQFFPTPFGEPREGSDTRLEQVWFRGAHADIGGGYAETGLSDIALAWMVEAARRHGLAFTDAISKDRRPDPLARMHDELSRKPAWRRFGSWPRWHPVPGAENPADPAPPGTLHPSVLQRMTATQARLGRPDFMRLDAGQCLDIDVQASREWDRTGIVLEPGCYRVTYLGGEWRNAEDRPCGPAGEPPHSVPAPRRWFRMSRRMPDDNWTCLCAAVAHPRDWKLYEHGLGRLIRYLFWKDPEELSRQVAPIGRGMGTDDASTYLLSRAEPGLLYFFANDLWHTAANNSGGLRLRVERVRQPSAGRVVWELDGSGCWLPPRMAPVAVPVAGVGRAERVDA